MKFTYWNNSPTYHAEKLAVIIANCCTESDKQFVSLTGIDPVKNANIGVVTEKETNVPSISEFDDIIITGTATSGVLTNNKFVVGLECTVATVSNDGYIKVWPNMPSEWNDGKLWFNTNAPDFSYKFVK